MSENEVKNENDSANVENVPANNEVIYYNFADAIPLINNKYIALITELLEKFKYHDELYGTISHDLKIINEKLSANEYHILIHVTNNFLFCLEQINDANCDYFIYQKEKIHKKNGKKYKNKFKLIFRLSNLY